MRGFKSLADTNPLGMMRYRRSCDLPGRGAPIADSALAAARPSDGTGAHITGICIHAEHHVALRYLMIPETIFPAERKSPYAGPNLP
jgi:hypothetical protein